MAIAKKTTHVTPSGGNVFIDLGFPPKEAAALKADSDRIIRGKLALKGQLMTALAHWIEAKALKPAEAAEILGVPRARVSDVVQKKTAKVTIDELVNMLQRTGKRVTLSVD